MEARWPMLGLSDYIRTKEENRMTEEEFKEKTGADPIQDDLERANCEQAGQRGHWMCGVTPCCGMPRFIGCDCKR